jgi:hypothetical protein
MKWKSFKQEQPLEGQRLLVYNPLENISYSPYEVVIARKDNRLEGHEGFFESQVYCFWIPIPCLPVNK